MSKKLTITLNEVEESNIHGWVNYLAANPQYIGVPGRMTPGGPINLQTRIVLEDQSRERFNEIAAQFGVVVPSTPVPPPSSGEYTPSDVIEGAPFNWNPPAGTFENQIWEFGTPLKSTDPQILVVDMPPGTSVSVPLLLPSGPWNVSTMLSIGLAEYQAPPTYRQACISKYPNDYAKSKLNGSISAGMSVMPTIDVAAQGWQPGQIVYLNVRCWVPDYDDPMKGQATNTYNARCRLGAPAGGWPH
jgi:hypothetical protein